MPGTLETLLVLGLAIVPGILFKVGYEAVVGPWGAHATDRLLRVLATSAAFHAVFAVATYTLWQQFIATGALASPDAEPPEWLLLIPLAYIGIPYVVGIVFGKVVKQGPWILPDPHPTAREYLFGFQREGWVRLKLKDGRWLAGSYGLNGTTGLKGYASQYGEARSDLMLSTLVQVDPATGEWSLDEAGQLSVRDVAVWVPWEGISVLEFDPIDSGA